jgi:hypothetical protein
VIEDNILNLLKKSPRHGRESFRLTDRGVFRLDGREENARPSVFLSKRRTKASRAIQQREKSSFGFVHESELRYRLSDPPSTRYRFTNDYEGANATNRKKEKILRVGTSHEYSSESTNESERFNDSSTTRLFRQRHRVRKRNTS